MEDQQEKIQRNRVLIKGFMAIILVWQAIQISQSGVWDFGELASAIGALLLLKGLAVSPSLLAISPRLWFSSNLSLSGQSYKYFITGAALVVVGMI